MADLQALPEWPRATVTVLSTAGRAVHAIPISTAVRAGDRTIFLAMARRRESVSRLRLDPRCALTVMSPGSAFTAHGIGSEDSSISDNIVAIRIDVQRIRDHATDDFAIESGVGWHWTDDKAAERDGEVRATLEAIAARYGQTH